MNKSILLHPVLRIAAILLLGAGIGSAVMYAVLPQGASAPESHAHDHSPKGQGEAAEATIYTCSMHPQIRQPEPGICPICEMDLTPLEAQSNDDPLVLQMSATAAKIAQIETITLGATGAGQDVLTLTGRLTTDERRVSRQVAHVPGRIESLAVTYVGERVRRGQLVARIYAPELVTAQEELIQALKLAATQPKVGQPLVQAAEQKLRYWKVPEETIATVKTSGEVQSVFPLYADADGVVAARLVAVGDYVRRGEVLLDMADLGQLWAQFDVYETDLSKVQVGSRVQFTTPALPGQSYAVTVEFVEPVIDPQTRVAQVRGTVNNASGRLKPSMLLRGTVQQHTGAAGLLVPKSAVLWTGKRSVVYVAVPEAAVPSYAYREVTLGAAVGDQYVVERGLVAGDRVVVQGAFVIDAAAQLNNQASMMNGNVTVAGASGVPDFRGAVTPLFQKGWAQVVAAYLDLKDALVATDAPQAKARAAALQVALEKVAQTDLNGAAVSFWAAQQASMYKAATQMTTEKDVEAQRKAFEGLSEGVIRAATAFGTERVLYVQHCPMAFDDKGANWVSAEDKIRNPYFGDKMLRCGIVEAKLE